MRPGLWMVNWSGKLFEVTDTVAGGGVCVVFTVHGVLSEFMVVMPSNYKDVMTYIGEV